MNPLTIYRERPTFDVHRLEDPYNLDITSLTNLRVIAASHCQRVKFFRKFWITEKDAISATMMIEAVDSEETLGRQRDDFTQSSGDSLYAAPPPPPGKGESKVAGTNYVAPLTLSPTSCSISSTDPPVSSSTNSVMTMSSTTTASTQHLQFGLPQPSMGHKAPPPHQESTVPVQKQESIHACPDCPMKFDNLGLRNKHQNRKHNLRFACSVCPARFGLRLDLKRHNCTVHEALFGPLEILKCGVAGCATPTKIFNRKDNYMRHVERCQQAVATRGMAL